MSNELDLSVLSHLTNSSPMHLAPLCGPLRFWHGRANIQRQMSSASMYDLLIGLVGSREEDACDTRQRVANGFT